MARCAGRSCGEIVAAGSGRTWCSAYGVTWWVRYTSRPYAEGMVGLRMVGYCAVESSRCVRSVGVLQLVGLAWSVAVVKATGVECSIISLSRCPCRM